jgi:benzoyl-CoA reductase/2-hydroxyglutaryl-CoA dehydratase subunit BcrC/BadD/HgdB
MHTGDTIPSDDVVAPFEKALHNRRRQLRQLASSGHPPIGYFCTYTPVEIIHAAGFVPIRIMGGPGIVEKANTLVPDFICPYMKRSLERALNGDYRFLKGLVQGYTCDVACGMLNIWKENIPGEIFHAVPIPYNDNPASRAYYHASLQELIDRLNSAGGAFSKTTLERSLALYDRIRHLLTSFYDKRYDGRLNIGAGDLLTIIQAGWIMPPEAYLRMLEKIKTRIVGKSLYRNTGIPILVSGSLIESRDVMDTIESLGGRIVADDLCSGLRWFSPPGGNGAGPIDRVIDRHHKRFPCPARSRATQRAEQLATLVTRAKARGVLLLIQKFCTPHLADIPIISADLKEKGYPVMLVELDETGRVEGPLKTRLESFLEMMAR